MSWLKTFTESVKLVSQDVAHMAEDVVGKAGESLRKMAQTDHVASVEEAACSVRDLEGAILLLQGWNQDLNKKIGQISDERLMEHGVGATPTKRDTSFVGEEKSPSTLALEEDRGGQQEHDASIVLECQQGTTTTPTTTGHQGTQGTTGHDLGVVVGESSATTGGVAGATVVNYTRSSKEQGASTRPKLFGETSAADQSAVLGSFGVVGAAASSGTAGAEGAPQKSRKTVVFQHILLKSRALEFLFRSIHAVPELQTALRPAVLAAIGICTEVQGATSGTKIGGEGGTSGTTSESSSTGDKSGNSGAITTAVTSVVADEAQGAKIEKEPSAIKDESFQEAMEKKFAKELWTLLMELTLPNSESLLLDLFKFMQSLASGDPLPGSFFAMLDRLKRDWRAALFATERVLLSQNAEQIKNAMERKVDNVSSLKPAAILTTYKAQNLEAHKSQALLAYLTDVHDCDLHIVERWTTALAQNHSDKQNVSWSGIALKLQTQLDQSAQQREAMQKRKEALEDASKTQREELGTQLGGLSDGKKEVQVRVDALEKEKVELEAKLQTINTELSELKAQVGRVENSEHALKRETENALVFYEENLVVLKKQEALAMREKTMLEQMKLTCERGGEIQISYLRSAIEGQKKLAEEAYAALKAEGLRHFDLEAVRLRTAMTLVEQSCVVFQECKFAVGQTGGGLSSSGLEQGTSTNSSPGTTGHEQRELERLKQQKLRDSLMEVKRAVLLRDRCKAEVDAFLTKYKSRLLQEEKTKVAQLLEEWQKHQAKHEKLLTEDEALRSFLTTNKATTGTTPCPSGGEHQYLQYQHPARHQTSNNVDARTSSSGETALNQMASKSEAVMGNLTSAFSATGSFLGKLRDENFPPLPPEGGGKAVPEKNTSSTTSKGVLAGGLFDQFSSDINTLFFSSPAPSPSGAEKVGSVNTATTSGAAGASAAGGTKLFDTSGTATGRTKTTIPATSEPIPVRENAPAPSSSGPVEFHSMATPENSPAAATSQEQTFAPFAAAADAAGKTTAAASNVEVPTVTPTPTTGESSTTTVVAPPVATATVVTTTAAGAVSFKTATQAPPPAGASAPTVPGAAPTAAPVAKKADDDDDIFAMFEADLGLDSKPFAPPARINADAE